MNNNSRKTLSALTGTRRVMPMPTVADKVKKKNNNRKKVKEQIKKGNYDF